MAYFLKFWRTFSTFGTLSCTFSSFATLFVLSHVLPQFLMFWQIFSTFGTLSHLLAQFLILWHTFSYFRKFHLFAFVLTFNTLFQLFAQFLRFSAGITRRKVELISKRNLKQIWVVCCCHETGLKPILLENDKIYWKF